MRARAFTFLELMFVVVIIGLLSTIVAMRMSNRIDTIRQTTALQQIAIIGAAVEQYHLDMGAYPTNAQGLEVLVKRPEGGWGENWDGPYLKSFKLPKDPWGRDYRYRQPGEHLPDFDVWSLGKDGQEGTEDDVIKS